MSKQKKTENRLAPVAHKNAARRATPKSANARHDQNGHQTKGRQSIEKPNKSHPAPARNGHKPTENKGNHTIARHSQPLEKFQGTLDEFNLGPTGGVEGFLLCSNGQTVQINVSSDIGFAVVRGIGQTVEATVELEEPSIRDRKGEHPVYRLVTLNGMSGKPLVCSYRSDGDHGTLEGVVKRINYNRNGEANGVILNSGDFVCIEPEGMKRMKLHIGDKVTAEGVAGVMPLGQQIIRAKVVNGHSVHVTTTGTAKKTPRR